MTDDGFGFVSGKFYSYLNTHGMYAILCCGDHIQNVQMYMTLARALVLSPSVGSSG